MTVGDLQGDGSALRFIPPPVKGLLRQLLKSVQSQREQRLLLTAQAVYPILQTLEEKSIPAGQRVLQGVTFSSALTNDLCIERGLRLFKAAWRYNLVRILDPSGKPIPIERPKTVATACGITVQQAEIHFIDIALNLLFKNNPRTLQRMVGTVSDPDALPKMRVLSQFQPLALTEIINGLGPQAGHVLAKVEPERLYALASLKSFHLRALKQALGAGFKNLGEWDAEVVRAIAHGFECVEQIRDLGEGFAMVTSAESLVALGRWEKRDITERVNEERRIKGLDPVKGRRFDTDIGVARRVLGNYFNNLVAEPADLLTGFGKLVAQIRLADKVERAERIEEIKLFGSRFLEYMTTDALRAIGMAADNPTTFGEALHILEGLFSKPGIGRKFFEGPLQTAEGIKALAGMKADIDAMKRQGSIKSEAEIGRLIANSDILDQSISPFISFK